MSQSSLHNIHKLLGCPEMLPTFLVAFHENMKARVQFHGSMSKTFLSCRGVKQGCILALTLFNIFSSLLAHAFLEEDGVISHVDHWATSFWSCFFILIFLCFLMLFGALSPKMTLVFS